MGMINEWCIWADIKVMALRDRVFRAIRDEHGVETLEFIALVAIILLVAIFIGNKLGASMKDKAASIANDLGGATFTP